MLPSSRKSKSPKRPLPTNVGRSPTRIIPSLPGQLLPFPYRSLLTRYTWNFQEVSSDYCFSGVSLIIIAFPGSVRVRDTKLDPHQFRTMVDINGREWLVFIRFSLQVAPEKYAYELFFAGKYRENLRARYVGKLDELLSDGRALFRQVESLHGLNLNKYAWWALNKIKIPIITKQPGHCEARCLPFHMRKNEDGLETHEPGVFEPNDFVTYVADGKHIQAYVLARHEPVCAPAERLYVLLCLGEREYVVHTVLPKDIRPPEIQSVVRPQAGDCWWVRDHTECMMNPFLEQHLSFCPPPRDAFKRGHVVSVPDPSCFNQRIPACVTRAWVIDGRMAYKVSTVRLLLFRALSLAFIGFPGRCNTQSVRTSSTMTVRPFFGHRTCSAHLSSGMWPITGETFSQNLFARAEPVFFSYQLRHPFLSCRVTQAAFRGQRR